MGLSVSFYKKDVENIIAAFKKNDLNAVEKIHMKHQTEDGQMKVLLPVIQMAGEIAQKDPSFALAVSEYVTFHSMGLNDAQRDMLQALRRHDVKTAFAACQGDDATQVLNTLARMPHSKAFTALEGFKAAYTPPMPATPSRTLKTGKKAFLRVV